MLYGQSVVTVDTLRLGYGCQVEAGAHERNGGTEKKLLPRAQAYEQDKEYNKGVSDDIVSAICFMN